MSYLSLASCCFFSAAKTELTCFKHVPTQHPLHLLRVTFIFLRRYPPFFDDNPFGIYQKILAGKLEFPRHLDFYVK